MCATWNKDLFSSPLHPQANGQVEIVNKIIKTTLKTKLDEHKGAWLDELPKVLWAHRTIEKTVMRKTPFSLSFEIKVVIPVEMGMPGLRTQKF